MIKERALKKIEEVAINDTDEMVKEEQQDVFTFIEAKEID